jgi:hypothetical protein
MKNYAFLFPGFSIYYQGAIYFLISLSLKKARETREQIIIREIILYQTF